MKYIFKNTYRRKTVDSSRALIYVLLAFMLGMLAVGTFYKAYDYFKGINKQEPLLSPLSDIGNLVYASEPRKPLTLQEEIAEYICSKPWDCQMALRIARCESGLNPNATHLNKDGTTDRGIFQINSVHGLKRPFNWKENIDYAIQKLYTPQGFRPWKSSIKCHGVK